MEVISGIISGILLLTVLVTFPLGVRARRRTLKEIAELGSQLEEKTKSLVDRVKSLVGEEEMTEIPRFASEDEERDFWATHDSVGFLKGAEQVNLEYVGREHEFILVPSAESEPLHTDSINRIFKKKWVATARHRGQPPEWKYVDIELGMVS